jgi:hypothetical protein
MEKFKSSNQPYTNWNVSTTDTQSHTCFGTSWMPLPGSPYIGSS